MTLKYFGLKINNSFLGGISKWNISSNYYKLMNKNYIPHVTAKILSSSSELSKDFYRQVENA